ncbi:MAG: hypothetical protein HN758_01590 [Verrucomicrobia bacterium]|nr:hypothetical protein [Verrucomicrobiota bacterium]MBT5063227.1 hypothetical protein [Verrucomicrobiota bacterium]MBT5478874.1 hypothetical protein [Verrucomicrobiota bacterium]MBT6239494.1 hypothetical protein [Verrucomicrobiota bacterium]MBT7873098.1 hypothetical protein [Verrucomicrobiota bacterium]
MKHFECVRKYLDMTCRMFGMEYSNILKLGMITQGHTACCITTTQLNFVEVLQIPPHSCPETLRGETPVVRQRYAGSGAFDGCCLNPEMPQCYHMHRPDAPGTDLMR